jgi:asparagine synthase (glutamine-hydrolysing)
MCGIAGLFAPDHVSHLSGSITGMLNRIRHRGPDGQGTQYGNGDEVSSDARSAIWALGHVRLAILDLSDAGLQPMTTDDRRIWISYNGEVYNYVELAESLRARGHRFRTGTDTEVILAAYREWGPECLTRFRGMFAFLLIDLDQGLAMAARDRLGIKPLYFWQGSGFAAIASELKQFHDLPGFQPRLNLQLAVDYLGEGLLGHEAESTLLKNVHALRPGTSLVWSLRSLPNPADASTYWDPPRQTIARTWDEAVAATAEKFRSAVRLRLRSDVAVGTCLSGGIDSSSIVGVAAHDFATPMKTFSVCHDDPNISEEHYIDDVARFTGSENIKLRLTEDAALAEFDQFVYHQDEPVFSLSQFGEYVIMRLAKEHGVTVLLNGQGGDEALCGYRKFAFFYLRQLLKEHRTTAAAGHIARTLWSGDRQMFQFWQGVRYVPGWMRRRYDPLDGVLRPGLANLRRTAWHARMRGQWRLRDHQWADLRVWSLPVLLRYQDRNSMAHGVEARVPMVDHEFVELALTLPEDYFFARGMTKRLLVDGIAERLPPSLRVRRTKLGFDTPQASWMRGRLGKALEDRVARCERLETLVDREQAIQLFKAYRHGAKNIPHFVLFRLACFATWLDRFQIEPETGTA